MTGSPIELGILAAASPRNGGTLPYSLSMIDALKRLPRDRYRLTIFTGDDNDSYDRLGLPVVRIESDARFLVKRPFRADPFTAVDKIIAPIYSTLLLSTSRPFAFTLHDLQEKHYPENFGLPTRAWRHATNRLLTWRARRIICESEFVRNDIIRHFKVPRANIAVVPAPPPATLAAQPQDAEMLRSTSAKFNLPGEYVFYPAQFWPHKNHLRLTEAFARIAEAHPGCGLVLTGQKRFEYARIMERAKELQVLSRLVHVGHVTEAELRALYLGATVVAIPTLFESISLPIYEAFALGRPVCASNVVALPEQVGDAGLLFNPFSVEDMAASLARLLASAELRSELADRGRRRVASVTHDGYAQRLSQIVDDL